MVYIKSNDLGQENYIRYATFNIDYDKETYSVEGSLNEAQLLQITPPDTTTTTTQPLPTPIIPDPNESKPEDPTLSSSPDASLPDEQPLT